ENGEVFLLQALAPDAVEGGGIGDAGLDRLALDVLIAEHLQENVVALRFQAEMFEPEQHAHPGGGADAGERDFFAAQFFSALDIGPGDKVVSVASGKSGDDLEIVAGADGGQSRA